MNIWAHVAACFAIGVKMYLRDSASFPFGGRIIISLGMSSIAAFVEAS